MPEKRENMNFNQQTACETAFAGRNTQQEVKPLPGGKNGQQDFSILSNPFAEKGTIESDVEGVYTLKRMQ